MCGATEAVPVVPHHDTPVFLDDDHRPATGDSLDLVLSIPEGPLALPAAVVRLCEAPLDKARGFSVTRVGAGAQRLQILTDLPGEQQ